MNTKILKIKGFRSYLLKQIDGLSSEQFNTIPPGYRNNLIWNLGHLICAQQNMCYVKANLPIAVDDKYFSPFLSGTKPEGFIAEHEIGIIKTLLITTMDKLQEDLNANIFSNYSPPQIIANVYGFEVNTIEGALEYLLYHDGFHGGYILSMKHLL